MPASLTDKNQWVKRAFFDRNTRFSVDVGDMRAEEEFFSKMEEKAKFAFKAMKRLEGGEIANKDENRMVGHYWLRSPDSAPSEDITKEIKDCVAKVKEFSSNVLKGEICAERGNRFETFLLIGIGGSALGPQFVSHAIGSQRNGLKANFIDNTDPDGIYSAISSIEDLSSNLTIVISKSGGTRETLNGMVAAKKAYASQGLNFNKHAVAVTGMGSRLHKISEDEDWLCAFPMWDWVGGRTSEFSAVGLLPAALEGVDIDKMLEGAAYMDSLTRVEDIFNNPAMLLALMWHHAGGGRGDKAMVVLPYKDRLELFSRYLQQLVMESLGKERDLEGNIVNQGITVYGNKGSTDQHAYVQQLRDGRDDFFVTFIEVLKDFSDKIPEDSICDVENGITAGDYLFGFLHGTRRALREKGRQSLTITVLQVDEFNVGMLIALFERAVGFYASLVGINAYHQPGVEAGKKAATEIVDAYKKVADLLDGGGAYTVRDISERFSLTEELALRVLERMAANEKAVVDGDQEGDLGLWRYKRA